MWFIRVREPRNLGLATWQILEGIVISRIVTKESSFLDVLEGECLILDDTSPIANVITHIDMNDNTKKKGVV
jgi:hypothetical protein